MCDGHGSGWIELGGSGEGVGWDVLIVWTNRLPINPDDVLIFALAIW